MVSLSKVIAVSAVVATSFFAIAGPPARMPAPQSQGQNPVEPISVLRKSALMWGTAIYSDLRRTWYDFSSHEKWVEVTRRERQSTTSLWYEQVHRESCSYFVVDVRPVVSDDRVTELLVTGVFANSDSILERWTITYPPTHTPVGGYVPISQRPLPTVRRAELLRSAAYGHIRAAEPDQDGRFALFLTLENPTVHKFNYSDSVVSTVLTTAQVPLLATAQSLNIAEHAQEGRMLQVLQVHRWQDNGGSFDAILAKDPDNDGVFDAPFVMSASQWDSSPYNDSSVWVKFD